MLKVEVESYVNGYSLVVYDDIDGFLVREIAETKLEILNTMLGILVKMTAEERIKLEAAV